MLVRVGVGAGSERHSSNFLVFTHRITMVALRSDRSLRRVIWGYAVPKSVPSRTARRP